MARHSLSLLLVLLVGVSAKGGHHGKRGGCAKQCREASHSWNKCKGLVAEGVCSYLQTVQGGVCIPGKHRGKRGHRGKHGEHHGEHRDEHHGEHRMSIVMSITMSIVMSIMRSSTRRLWKLMRRSRLIPTQRMAGMALSLTLRSGLVGATVAIMAATIASIQYFSTHYRSLQDASSCCYAKDSALDAGAVAAARSRASKSPLSFPLLLLSLQHQSWKRSPRHCPLRALSVQYNKLLFLSCSQQNE